MKNILILILVFIGKILLCQNYLYESDHSGFHIAGQLGSSSGSTLLGIRPGYTYNGKTTLGLVIGAEHLSDVGLNTTAIRPYIDYLVLKENDNDAPVSLNLGAHYQYNSFPKQSGLSLSTIGFSINLLKNIEAGNTLLLPSIGVGWDHSTLNLFGITASDNTIGLGISMAAKFNQVYIEPLVSIKRGGAQFGLSVGLVFGE